MAEKEVGERIDAGEIELAVLAEASLSLSRADAVIFPDAFRGWEGPGAAPRAA